MTKKIVAVMILVMAAFAIALLAADTAREQKLQQAVDLMESKGDIARAIPMFEDVSQSSEPALAARGLLYLGQALERQDAARAREAYEKIIKDFPKTDSVGVARQRLATLAPPKQTATADQHMICEECGDADIDFSSDGRWMVATDWSSGDLEIRETSTGNLARKLMLKPGDFKTSKADAENPVFSKDGRQIAYFWCTNEKPDHIQIRIVANEPGAKPRIVMEKPEYKTYWPLDWTKDGKRLLVALVKPDRTWEIAWVSVANGAVQPIKSMGWRFYGAGTRPRLSQDEKFILYSVLAVNPSKIPPEAAYSRDVHVYVLSVDGSTENEIVKGSNINDGPVWAPDGTHVLFASNRRGTSFDLWSVPVQAGKAAGELRLVQEEVGRMQTIGSSRSSYFFHNIRKGGQDVFISAIKQDGTAAPPRRLTDYLGANVGASWSPDGKSIAFKRRRPDGSNLWDVTILSLITGEEQKYTSGSPAFGRGLWFHDSASMMVMGQAFGPGLFRLDLRTKETTPLPKDLSDAAMMNVLSPDDTWYVGINPDNMHPVADGRTSPRQIVGVNLTTGERKVAFNAAAGEGIYGFAVSPDNHTLAIVAGVNNDCRLFTIGLDGSSEHELYRFKLTYWGWAQVVTWTHDGRSIYFGLEGEAGTAEARVNHIMRIPASGGDPEPVGVSIRANAIRLPQFIGLSPDDSQILYSTDEANVDQVWALDNVQAALR